MKTARGIMTEISAAMVKALRESTGQGMMDCKKALTECNGDMEAAVDWLRKKGLAQAEKRAARSTSEGLIAVHLAGGSGAMVEVLCETDFCARNDEFRAMVQQVAQLAVAGPDGPVQETDQIKTAVQECFNKIGENMRYSRGAKISAPAIGHYVHHNSKVGVLVGVEGDLSPELLHDLCMHIAFADPMAITTEEIPADVVEREKRLAAEQAVESGKPPAVVEKIVAGKVGKFLASNALLEQPFVREEKKKVKAVLGSAKVTTFARFAVGQE
jgi:elongation factor Ts